MNVWVALIIGLIVGWLIELLIDIFYWRNRRLCPDDNVIEVQAQLDKALAANGKLEADLNGRNTRIAELEATINGWRGELDGLNEESKGLGIGTIFPNGELKLGGFIAGLKDRFNQFRADLTAKESQIGDLNLNLNHKEADLNKLQASFDAKEAELGTVRAELDGLDKETNRLGLGSLFAGGGLAISGFLANLRDRFDGDDEAEAATANLEGELVALRGDLETKDARIGELEGELGNCSAKIGALEADLNGRNAELASLRAELSELDAEVDGLGLGKVTAAGGGLALGGFLASLRSRFDKDDDSAELNGRISDLQAQLDECQSSLALLDAGGASKGVPQLDGPRGLSMVWGLNSQTSDALEEKGVYTYSQLGATNAADVDDALTLSQSYYSGWDNGRIHGSWVEQSHFAANGDWDGLFGYQQSNFDLVALKDDLKKMWGIGPKIEKVLNGKGIYLFSQLASVPAERITDILRDAGDRFNMSSGKLHESWPNQARLADQGDWDGLKELTDKLSWSNVN